MGKTNKLIGIALVYGVASVVFAHPDPRQLKNHPWQGTNLSAGIVNNTGNTEQTEFNLGTNVQYQKDRWKNVFNLQAQLTIANKVINKEQANINEQINYSFGSNKRNFLYGAGMFSYNRFAPYEYQSTIGVGYGRYLWMSDSIKWSVQAGPAFRYDRTQTEHEGKREIIGQAGTNFAWKIIENLSFTQGIRYDMGKSYNYLNTISTLNTRLAGHWSLLLSYVIEYYSKIPRGSTSSKKLDTTTTLALAYNL
jgi:putative salt-induced outer membrane protein